uniref:THAP4-like heme-binding domain-containing protein n=2 Tax=Schistocephalus solidus TaxID=70667 RepID=A0A0X3PS85_SCHSO
MSKKIAADVYTSLNKLRFLLGRWRGVGIGKGGPSGQWAYEELLEISTTGQPWISYVGNGYKDNAARHCEMGFFRGHTDGHVSMCLTDTLGNAYLLMGKMPEDESTPSTLTLTTESVVSPFFGRQPRVTKVERTYTRSGDSLTMHVKMATTNCDELEEHLHITYEPEVT